ncbi:MAG: hypothetical protein WCF67_13200 [Chitinophagaceae bacterium]
MRYMLDILDYSPDSGINYKWEDGFEIYATVESKQILIKANKAGLINLAQDGVPSGHHVHLDDLNSLEDGSFELVIEKREDEGVCEKD